MTTPLSDPDNVKFVVVENYEAGFTDDEVSRWLNGQSMGEPEVDLTNLPAVTAAGDFEETQHPRDGKGRFSEKAGGSSGKALKITHMLVHKGHGKPGSVLAVTSDGKKRVRWDGKKYELQRQTSGGEWDTEQTAIKSKAYTTINEYASDWEEPGGNGDAEVKRVDSTPSHAPNSTSAPKPKPKPEPSATSEVKPVDDLAANDVAASEQKMLSAYNAGYTVKKQFAGGLSGSKVELLELSDGSTVVRKTTPLGKSTMGGGHGNTTKQEYLAGQVYSAINQATGNDNMITARVNENTLLTTLAQGSTGTAVGETLTSPDMTKQKVRSVVNTELKRHTKLNGAKEIAMLDFLTRNNDRHGLNWIVDGDSVKPVDQGFTFVNAASESYKIKNTDQSARFESIPGPFFVEQWFKPRLKDDYSGYALTPKYSRDEVARIKNAVSALKPTFEREGALDWYDSLMARFTQIEESVKK